jgi:hypothetical protein
MADLKALKNKWQPMVRWAAEVTAAQTAVMAETGVWVDADRIFGHMGMPGLDKGSTEVSRFTALHTAVRPRRSKRASSRATSGFPVVSSRSP